MLHLCTGSFDSCIDCLFSVVVEQLPKTKPHCGPCNFTETIVNLITDTSRNGERKDSETTQRLHIVKSKNCESVHYNRKWICISVSNSMRVNIRINISIGFSIRIGISIGIGIIICDSTSMSISTDIKLMPCIQALRQGVGGWVGWDVGEKSFVRCLLIPYRVELLDISLVLVTIIEKRSRSHHFLVPPDHCFLLVL